MTAEIPRITRAEFYPIIRKPQEALKAVVPPFPQKVIDAGVEAAKELQLNVTLIFRHTGQNPQEVVVELRPPQSPGDQINIELSGDLEATIQSNAEQVIANYEGIFYRRENPQADKPIAEDKGERAVLVPEEPMVIGIASERKGQYYPFELDPTKFPTGVRIVRFMAPDTKEGTETKPGETILCYVVPL